MLGDVLDFQQQSRAIVAERDLRDGTIEDAIHAAGRRPRQFALDHALAAGARSLEQRQESLGAPGQFGEATTERLIATQPQQRLCGCIQINDM